MGHHTGIDLPKLIAADTQLPGMLGHDVPSQIIKAGRRLDLYLLTTDFDELTAHATSRV